MIVQFVSWKSDRYTPFLLIAALLSLAGMFAGDTLLASDKPIIGAEEYVIVMPYGFKLPARVDTGAATTSLDARNISVTGSTVSFTLPPRFGGSTITLPIIDWRYIRTSKSHERRPVVEMDLCIASKRLRARVNLNDRSHMRYPMIIGRNVITGNFLVDTSQSFTTPPWTEDTEADR